MLKRGNLSENALESQIGGSQMNRIVRLLCKLIQRQTYSCLSTKYGTILCLGGLLVTLISLIQFGEVLIEWSMERYSPQFSIYRDNVGRRSYQDRLCLPIPIDVVYTWVNGSDPELIHQLRQLKTDLVEKNESSSESYTTFKANRKHLKKGFGSQIRVDPDVKCLYSNCVKARIAVVVNSFNEKGLTLKDAQDLHPSYKYVFKVLNGTSKGKDKKHIFLMYFPSSESMHNALVEKVKVQQRSLDVFIGFFTTDNSLENSIESKHEVIVTGFQKYTDLAEMHKELQKKFDKEISDIIYDPKKHIAVVYFNDEASTKRALQEYKGNYSVKGGAMLKVSQVYLTWTYSWSYVRKHSEPAFEVEDQVISDNRFADNQELKYSLRSIEKFSPWIRNIYIVTNGQIPSWLNLDNPRVKIISHKDIFVNKSHLPTFSSPAIESHLHRIPGLSQKFIYMNDDVMFGDYVWPDDFYTHSKGQKIFLTWSVPNCNEGCPASWIQDKYCDKACNVSECDYDGGDCTGIKQETRYSYQSWQNQQSRFRLDFCSTGCADSWVGDRYCDTSCNVYSCGFDAGDCGILQFDKLHGVDINQQTREYHLPDGLQVVFFNLSTIFGQAEIVMAEHSENMVIRTAIVTQKYKLLTLTLRKNYTLSTISLNIKGIINGTKTIVVNFNVTLKTTETFQMTTELPPSPTFTSTIPTVPVVKTSRDFLSIKALYSNQSKNYWTVVNGSIQKPEWMKLDQGIYNIPEISNNTFASLPQQVKNALQRLDMELSDGDLTKKGYKRRKAKILNEFLANDNYGKTAAAYQETQSDVTRKSHQAKSEKQDDTGRRYNRHLLSIGYDKEEKYNFLHSPVDGRISTHDSQLPPEDEIFLAKWIADTKNKQLSFTKNLEDDHQAWLERYGDWDPKTRPSEASFLPWERQGFFQKLQNTPKHVSDKYVTWSKPGRQLLDTFADSLLHVHRIYNHKFGYAGRKVPAHMPHMIDVQIMKELQSTFPEEFDRTSSHKLRSSDDMQFAFSYNYFVIGQTTTLNTTALFAELDSDHSGSLSSRELRTLAARIYSLPLKLSDIKQLERAFINCSLTLQLDGGMLHQYENVIEDGLLRVNEALLSGCTEVTRLLNESKGMTKKYKHETVGDDEIAFKMISNNASLVLRQLDNIRAHRKKFICLNDNIDHSQNATLVRALLVDFYESLFPSPSQFELPKTFRNKFLYIENVNRWVQEERRLTEKKYIIVSLIIFLGIIVVFWQKVLKWLVYRLRRRFVHSISETRLLTI